MEYFDASDSVQARAAAAPAPAVRCSRPCVRRSCAPCRACRRRHQCRAPTLPGQNGAAGEAAVRWRGAQAKKYAFKCHRRSEGGRDTVYPVNAIAFAPFHGTFATGGALYLTLPHGGARGRRRAAGLTAPPGAPAAACCCARCVAPAAARAARQQLGRRARDSAGRAA